MRLGLASRLALTVALFLIPAGAWMGFTVQHEREQVAETVEARLNVQLKEVTDGVERHLALAQNTLRILVVVPEMQADAETCNRFLAGLGSSDHAFLALARAGADGWVDCATPGLREPIYLGNRSYFRQTIETGNFTIGSFRNEDFADTPVVTTSYPLHNATGEITGALISASAVAMVLQLERVQALPEGSVVTVTDPEGIIIARSGPSRFVGETFGDRQVRLSTDPGEVYRARGVDGVERLYVTNRLILGADADTFIVSTGVPVDAAYGPVVDEAIREALFVIGLLILMGAAGVLAVRFVILRPVKQIAGTARSLRSGQSDARVTGEATTRTDEIGDLARAMNDTADELLRQIQELEDANVRLDQVDALKTQIINTVAHELRTPMVALKLQFALLERQYPPGRGAMEALERVHRNVVRLDRLVQSLIKVAKILAGESKIETRPVDLRPLLASLEQEWAPRAEESQLTFQVTPISARVRAQPEALREILHELLDNAFKFTPPGGDVWVRVVLREGIVHFIVEDSGIGLRPGFDDVKRRLEPHGGPVRGGRIGLGLGLFIARALVEQMGGSLSHESSGPGQGTRAIMRLEAE